MPHATARLLALSAACGTALVVGAGPASAQTPDASVPEPSSFTSMLTVMATPDQVVNPQGAAAPGEPGSSGTFNFRINSADEIICYDITLRGVTPPYQSPARTATHIHQAAAGQAGPPRLAFPNPEDTGDGTLRSTGCMQGPFTTGVVANGADTGAGFTLAQIEADPGAFAADSHTAQFVPGVVRGQLAAVPMGGVETGAGGTAEEFPAGPAALGAAVVIGVAATTVARRRARTGTARR